MKQLLLILTVFWTFSASGADRADKTLDSLLAEAYAKSPELHQMLAKQRAMLEKSDAAGYWPDPTLSGNYFLKPIETRLGEQRANFMVTQPIPFPGKFSAIEDQVRFEAEAIGFEIEATKLRIAELIKSLYYKAYAVQKRLEFIQAERDFLESLSQVALARVTVGSTGKQDVTQATLEISQLEQVVKNLQQDLRSLRNRINRVLDRPAATSITFAKQIAIPTKLINKQGWKKYLERAKVSHPNTLAAKKRIASAEAGIKFSKLRAVPDLKVSASYFSIAEDNPKTQSGTNEDAYSVGASISIPIWWGKYSAYKNEAVEKRQAATHAYQMAMRVGENALIDLWEQAETSQELLQIYDNTILPQAEQVLRANQSSYQQGSVSFDRVITDFQRLLKLQVAQYNEQARFLTLLAQIENVIGTSLMSEKGRP